MGIKIVGNLQVQELGITITDPIITLNGQVHLTKLIGPQRVNLPYRLRGEYSVWGSELAYSRQYEDFSPYKPILKSITFFFDVDTEAIKGDLLALMYSKLKEKYPNSVDC
jgi:hypothetical protein